MNVALLTAAVLDNSKLLHFESRLDLFRYNIVLPLSLATIYANLRLKKQYVNVYKYTLCSEKNTHSHFLSYLHELFVDLNKNCSEYTQGLIDSDNVKIRYSLRSMT